MKREGILFQGLCIQESGNGFIQEEGVYYGEKVFFKKEKRIMWIVPISCFMA